ncbi:MAG: DUF1189 family protein [Armatimonadota bacterium]
MFFFKRFGLAFNPVGGYGRLMKASGGGAFGVLAIMTLLSCLGWMVFGTMIVDKVMPYTQKTFQSMPPFSVENGKLSMPAVPQPYTYKGGDWVVVVDTTNRTNLGQVKATYGDVSSVLLTSDMVYMHMKGKPDSAPNSMALLNGANNQNAAAMLRATAVMYISIGVVIVFIFMLIGRGILVAILGGVMSVIPVDGSTRPFIQTCNIVAHAMVPATILEIIVNYIGVARLDIQSLSQPSGSLAFPLFMVVTVAMAFFAHFKAEPEDAWA